MKTKVIAGNWKMHKTINESLALVKELHHGLTCPNHVDIVVAPSLTALFPIADYLKNSFIGVAAQNVFWEKQGAYTGEVSAEQVKDTGADYVIIGHSERRQFFGETNETVNKKIKASLVHRLIPIVCVGETLDERNTSVVKAVLRKQISEGLAELSIDDISNIIIAYEPVWAIGTGLTASPDQAEEAHQMIRQMIAQQFNDSTAHQLRILYGGSVKPDNSKELLSQPNIDGALVGGASLKTNDFIKIVQLA